MEESRRLGIFRISQQGKPGAGGLVQEQEAASERLCSTCGHAAVTVNSTQRVRSCQIRLAVV